MTYSVLACEGSHDVAALSWLARICIGWKEAATVPEDIRGKFERTPPDSRLSQIYLAKDRHLLIVKRFGGKEGLLNQHNAKFLSESKAVGIGIIVDANDVGVDKRVDSFRTTFGRTFPHAQDAAAGAVWGETPRLGLWIAPNNKDSGAMDDALVTAARRSQKTLVAAGEAFVRSAEEIASGKWIKKRSKALLGTVYQVEAPGTSLAVGLTAGKCWFDEGIAQVEPFASLAKFIDAIGTGVS